MQIKNNSYRYGAVAQFLHWIVVTLIVTQVVLANKAGSLPLGAAKLATLAQHKSVGVTILALTVLRLIWRALGPIPSAPSGMAPWRRRAASISHFLLYALLLVTPLLGWLMSSARNFPVSWFGFATLPDFIEPSEAAFEFFREAHGVSAATLLVVALIHAAAALKHHFIDRDDVLRRMLPVKLRRPPSVE